ncbi:MAG: DUF4167 domain-containing protein [Rhodobacteraceae bacterium]|nr:MAG: DUF4167 domain-containing protein [Paracoccaceae bacterium]
MRSSKSRSRSRSNRSKPTGGNIINRVFDSSGPEGKVRGTPQQIIDKYNQLTRDAQLSGDRVASENFQQHAEHYLRLLSEAQKETDAKREEQERQNRERQAQRDRERGDRQDRDTPDQGSEAARNDAPRNDAPRNDPPRNDAPRNDPPRHDPADLPQPDVMEVAGDDADSGLVETPESKVDEVPEKPKRTRRKPAPRKKDDAPKAEDAPQTETAAPSEPAAPKKRESSRKKTPPASDNGDEPSQAAE